MIESALGLVLRTRPLSDTSLIVHWLTASQGRVATVAKGARRAKSPFRGKLDLFYLADFSFSRSRRSELHSLREISLRDTRAAFRRELIYLQQASYCAALIEQTTETETPLPGIFELMNGFLDALPRHMAQSESIFGFEFKLLQELGMSPDLAQARLGPGARELAKRIAQDHWETISRLRLSPAQREELRQFLHGFLIFHLGRIPASRAAAMQV